MVIYNQGADLFDITLTDLSGGVVFDELVNVIDYHVEKINDYEKNKTTIFTSILSECYFINN